MATPEELFGQRPQAKNAEELFGPRAFYEVPSFDAQFNDQFSQGSVAPILDAFGQGFKNAWGVEPLGIKPETEKALKDLGIFNDYAKGQESVIRSFNEAVLRPSAALADAAMRGVYAAARGAVATGELAERAGVGGIAAPITAPLAVLGGVAAAGMEAFPAGPFTGAPFVGTRFPHLGPLHAMEDLSILEDDPAVARQKATTALTPERGAPETPIFEPGPEVPLDNAPVERGEDVNARARAADPEAFDRYDTLSAQKRSIQEWMSNLQTTESFNIGGVEIPAHTPLKNVEALIGRGVTDQELFKLTTLPGEKAPSGNVSLIEQLRKDSAAIDAQLAEVAPRLQEAYKGAGETAEVPKLPPISFTMDEPLRGEVTPATEFAPPKEPPEIQTLAQRRPTIAQEVTRNLTAAGRPMEEARAAASLIQAYYETRAARFEGQLGSARDLYDADAPTIRAGEGGNRGALSLAENAITLFKSADASTFIHETAHNWFEDMLRDAARPEAPPDLKADLDAVKGWLQMEADRPTRTQHERFARGFERYMMEGVAPTQRLAGVFEKFKQWLTSLYQTVARLRSPITDEIRGVYDRLISAPRDETVIAPEREVGKDFAEVHENDLATATPENAIAKADEVRAERDQMADLLRAEINNGRKRARAAARTAGGSEERGGVAPAGGAETRPLDLGAGVNEEPTALVPSGTSFKAEGTPPERGNDAFGSPASRTVKDGRPVLGNIEAPADIDEAVRDLANSSAPRGEISQIDRINLADSAGLDPKEIDPGRVGAVFNSDEIRALSRLAIDAETDVWNKMQEAAESGDPLELAKSIARLEMIQAKAVQAAGEWGRAGQALRAFNETTGGKAANALDQLLKLHTGRSYDDLMQLALQAKGLQTPRQVGALIRSTKPEMGPIGRGITFWVTNSYLSGPFTHAVYFIGNQLRTVLQPIEAGVSGAIGAARRGLGVGPEDRAYMQEAGAGLSALIQGTQDAMRPAWESYKAGKQTALPGGPPTSPWGTYSLGSRVADNIIGQPTKIVAAIHQFSRVQFYTQYLYELSLRQALDEGLTGEALEARVASLRSNPASDIVDRARNLADTAMFQRQTPWNSLQASLSRWTERHVLAKIMFPFMKIGFELTRETIKRSPFAPALGEVRGQLAFKEGGAGFDEAVGKMALGTGLLGAGLYWASQGQINGFGPSDPKSRSEWMLTHKPYSVTIGNLSVPMAGLGPPGKLLQFGADMWETGHYAKKDDLNSLATAYAKAVIRAGLDEGFFRDVTNLGEAINDPLGTGGIRYLEGMAKGFIPYSSLLSQTNKNLIDPYAKDVEPGVAGTFDSIRAIIPGASWAIPNKLDMFGQPIPARGLLPAVMERDLANRYAADPTVQWLNQLGVGPGRLDRSILGVRLTEQQYHTLAEVSGQLSKRMLDAARPQLSRAPHGEQILEVDKILGKARQMARAKVIMDSAGSDNDIMKLTKERKLEALN